jgi:hypothetical protein
MLSCLDKTFCASPDCKNDCGRKITDEELDRLNIPKLEYVSYSYFCGDAKATLQDESEE